MKKRILIGFLTIALVSAGIIYLQFGRSLEILNSSTRSSSNYSEEHISVNLNKLFARDYEQLTAEIIERCRENKFKNFLFSYDIRKPNALYCTVYLNQHSFDTDNQLYSFTYTQHDNSGVYNFIDNPEKFSITVESSDN